jgi:predicted  nucleic acid-binding Zn-ribbon protein
MAVFKIDKNYEVILNMDAVKLVPELKGLDQDELRYVILVMDYVDGPFRKKPLEERKLLAKKKVYGNTDVKPETPNVLIGMDAYKSLIFDIRRETVDIYKSRIKGLQKETIQETTTFTRLKELDSTMSFLMDRIKTIEHELDIEESEEIELKGKKKLSYLEQWQRNQKDYREYKQSI